MKLINVGSGSKGNSTLILINDTLFLIDAGLCKKTLNEGLKLINKKINDISAIFITHSHIDHIKYINLFDFNKIYTVKDVLEPSIKPNLMDFNSCITINGVMIKALKTSHDVTNSCGFLFEYNKESLVYITDTGYLPFDTLKEIKNKNYYVIESNHDILKLLECKRTNKLKGRILSAYGHLANDLSAKYMLESVGDNTKALILAHLSEDCNTPDDAINTYYDIFEQSKYKLDDDIKLITLKQREITVYGED